MKTLLTIIMLTTSIYAADLRLEWQDNSDNESGFEVWRKVDDGDWTLVGATNADQATFLDGYLPVGSTLSYRVLAWNQFGQSDYTNIVSIGTYPPRSPSDLGGQITPDKPVSFIGPLEAPEASVKIRRDSRGRIIMSRG
jgi:hypothetical protein